MRVCHVSPVLLSHGCLLMGCRPIVASRWHPRGTPRCRRGSKQTRCGSCCGGRRRCRRTAAASTSCRRGRGPQGRQSTSAAAAAAAGAAAVACPAVRGSEVARQALPQLVSICCRQVDAQPQLCQCAPSKQHITSSSSSMLCHFWLGFSDCPVIMVSPRGAGSRGGRGGSGGKGSWKARFGTRPDGAPPPMPAYLQPMAFVSHGTLQVCDIRHQCCTTLSFCRGPFMSRSCQT